MKCRGTSRIKMPKTAKTVGLTPNNTEQKGKSAPKWKDIDWKAREKRVYKIQKCIYKASQRDDVHRHCHDEKTRTDGSLERLMC